MKFLLEHRLPKRLRYAHVELEAGAVSVSFSLDGRRADWHASIGEGGRGLEMTDKEYSRLRNAVPAVEMLDDDGGCVIVRNSEGYDEQWEKPRWILRHVRKRPDEE